MITLTITPDIGDPYKVTATSRDVLTWEKTTKGRSFVDLINEPTLVDLYRVAHLAAWRQGLTTAKNLQEFEATCEVAGIFDDEDQVADDEPDPTPPGHSTGPSSPSPSAPASPRRSGRKKANEQ
ncbi:MAG TPA: hypothetical protein VIQ30_15235 [Pseudonocardia sp.]